MDRRIFLFIIPVLVYIAFSTFRSSANINQKIIGKDKFYVSEDMGETWERFDVRDGELSLKSLNFLSIAIDPMDSDVVYLGARENGLYKSCCKGEYWRKIKDKNNVFSKHANVYDIVIDPKDSDKIYIATYQDKRGRFFRTQDGGNSWDEIYVTSEQKYAIFTIAINKHDSSIIYIGTGQGGLLKSNDYGDSWQIINWFDDAISDIAINSFNSNEMYVSTFNNGIYKTIDNGRNWISLAENMEEFSQAKNIQKIAIDPKNSNIIYIASKYGILTSKNKGKTWREVDMVSPPNTIPAISLAIGSNNTNYLFYGAGSILYNSIDRGRNWIVNQLPDSKMSVRVIAIDSQNPKLIYVGMHE